MKKFTALLVAVALATVPAFGNAKLQFLESLLFGAISSGVNAQIAKGQERPISAVKVVFDVYYIRDDGSLIYLVSWDPTTQTSVWFGDRVALKVKPFSNAGPSHDHTIYANDRLVEWRKVEGGKIVRGKPTNAQGVVGDYPFIYVKDLDMGFNQVKARVSKTEWGSATFVKLDVQQFMQLAADEQARLAIAGAGQSTYPVLQSYTAQMPDGTIRNFTSVEEFQLALQGKQNSLPTVDPRVPNPIVPNSLPKETVEAREEPKQEYCSVTLGAWQTSDERRLDFLRTNLSDTEQELLSKARDNMLAPQVEEVRLSSRRNQAIFLLSDTSPFTAKYRFEGKDYPITVRQRGGRYECVAWGSIKRFLVTQLIVTDNQGRERYIAFVPDTQGN